MPFADKDYVKAQGAKFSSIYKLWYVLRENENHDRLCEKYPFKSYDPLYLVIPYEDRDDAKLLGCLWDSKQNLWVYPYYSDVLIRDGDTVRPGARYDEFKYWIPKTETVRELPQPFAILAG